MPNFLKTTLSSPTRNLTLLYIAALCAIALLLLSGYLLINIALTRQSSASHLINIAGRQRMLSQKLSKEALAIYSAAAAPARAERAAQLRETLALWESSHVGLQRGDVNAELPGDNSTKISEMFAAAEPHYKTILDAGNELLAIAENTTSFNSSEILSPVEKILASEAQYLAGMNEIVFQYDRESVEVWGSKPEVNREPAFFNSATTK